MSHPVCFRNLFNVACQNLLGLRQLGGLLVKTLACCAVGPGFDFPRTFISKIPAGCSLDETLNWRPLVPVSTAMANDFRSHWVYAIDNSAMTKLILMIFVFWSYGLFVYQLEY